ncbi:MAG: aminotransferase class V-fold PLP-dependent enzyme [Candidatus Lokiarchaeota archaeon]|nr:aminotransferase class V-fold PLP-dependent enzyme [Candidatus Lokiarchaeota archaeon]
MIINWEKIRNEEFPSLKNSVHLKAAGGSPICRSAYNFGIKYLKDIYEKGDLFWDDYYLQIKECKRLIASYFNVKPKEIAFLINTSSSMYIVSKILENASIIYPEDEFPSSIHIFKKSGFKSVPIKSENFTYPIENFKNNITSTIKYIVHSHVQYLTGFRQNISKLGNFSKNENLTTILNATQSFGAFPIDLKRNHIDIAVASGLKWMCCGYGIGILYINEELLENDNLPISSWLSVSDPYKMNNDNMNVLKKTSSFDGFGGTPNFPGIINLLGGLSLIERIGNGVINNGINLISQRIIELTDIFLEKIDPLNFKIITPLEKEYRSGIITIEHKKAEIIFKELLKQSIYISLRNYPNSSKKTLLRFSFHYYNNPEDVEKTIQVLKRFNENE